MKKMMYIFVSIFVLFVLASNTAFADDCGPVPTMSHTVIASPKYTNIGYQSDGSYLLPNGQVILHTGQIVSGRSQVRYSYSPSDSYNYKWKMKFYNQCELNSIPKSDVPFVMPKLQLNLTPTSAALLKEFE